MNISGVEALYYRIDVNCNTVIQQCPRSRKLHNVGDSRLVPTIWRRSMTCSFPW